MSPIWCFNNLDNQAERGREGEDKEREERMDMDQRDVKFEERYKIRMDRQMNEV